MRQRVEGHKFEKEFENTFQHLIVLRLHTPNTKYSGLTQPADFVVIGNSISFVETKETGGSAFSITSMEQLDEILNYLKAKRSTKKKGIVKSNYYIIVHFINHKIIKVITAEYAEQLYLDSKRLHYNDENGYTFKTLKEMKEGDIF